MLIYSFQPHKEWRFIIYIIPPLTAVAAAGASWIWTRRSKTFVYLILALALIASTIASFAASLTMLAISRLNYPGAEALNQLHKLAENDTGIRKVHMDTLSCMTGVTRFLEQPSLPSLAKVDESLFWIYDKTEDQQHLADPVFWEGMDYALAEHPERVIGAWESIGLIEAFTGFRLVRPTEDMSVEGFMIDESAVVEFMRGLLRKDVWNQKNGDMVARYLECLPQRFERFGRRFLSKGWWIRMRMEPRIRILKKQKVASEDWAKTSDGLLKTTKDEVIDEP